MKSVSAIEAVKIIKSGDNVFVHGGAATPNVLLDALVARANELKDVTLYHLHTEGPAHYAKPEYRGIFNVRNLFVGANMRNYLDFDRVDYVPCFLSEMPGLLRDGRIKIDVALVQTSTVDAATQTVSLGVSVDWARAAVDTAKSVIALVNKQMPRTSGDGVVPVNAIDFAVEVDLPIYCARETPVSEVEKKIGDQVASLIEDGSCLQAGIGSIPNAVMLSLKNHKHLGLHTEMWSDGVLDLLLCGAIDNSKKQIHPGFSVCSFMMGSQKLYDYSHNNPNVLVLDASFVNNPRNIAQNDKMISVNSAVELDLTGQVCADSIGDRIISGVGGQIDFIRGASLSKGGKPIIAITSRTKKGESRIVPHLHAGAGVVTTRAHAHYVVTEYGIADLFAKSLGERAKALIAIAHPDDRDNLARLAHKA